MIVDTSAVVAIVLAEPPAGALSDRLADARPAIGAPALTEAGLVLESRLGLPGRTLLARLLQRYEFTIVPFGEEHWPHAVDAFVRFGKGRHPARLNFGDCLTYAVAHVANEPLLALGPEFRETDLALVEL